MVTLTYLKKTLTVKLLLFLISFENLTFAFARFLCHDMKSCKTKKNANLMKTRLVNKYICKNIFPPNLLQLHINVFLPPEISLRE